MGDRFDIRLDLGKDKDKGVTTLYMVGHDGIVHPIGSCVESLVSTNNNEQEEHSLCALTYSFSVRISDIKKKAIQELFKGCLGKRRKTTFKTIKRNCAKRNR
jgi:hypothetical protein